MNRRRKACRAAAVWAAVLLLIPAGRTAGEQVYPTYTYDYRGEALESPALYQPVAMQLGADMQTTPLKEPQELFVEEQSGRVYVSDTGNNRVLVLDSGLTLIREIRTLEIPETLIKGESEDGLYAATFSHPNGLYATADGTVYIADTDNHRIVVCDENGRVSRLIGSPAGDIRFTGIDFLPTRLTADGSGYLYVLCRGVYHGAIVVTPEGEFEGYFGANETEVTFELLMDYMWKRFLSAEQREQLTNYVPVEFSGLDMDENGFLYTCTMISRTGENHIKKFNFAGTNVLSGNPLIRADYAARYGDPETVSYGGTTVQTRFTDVCCADGMIYALDLQRGRLFWYDPEGRLLGAFGGLGAQTGTFQTPAAIDTQGEQLLVLDAGKGGIVRFAPTDYGRLLKKADKKLVAGRYAEAKEDWAQLLRLDNRSQLALIGMGKALAEEGDSEGALRCFEKGQDRASYAEVFKALRDERLKQLLPFLAVGLAVLCGALWLWRRKRKTPAAPRFRRLSRLRFTLCHPIKGFTQCCEERTASAGTGLLIAFIGFAALVVKRQFTGFSFNEEDPLGINILFLLAQSVLLLIGWSAANWSVTTLLDGKGRFGQIFYISAVSAVPYIAALYLYTLMSNCFVPSEGLFMTAVLLIGGLWSFALLWCGLSVVHEYSFSKTLGSILLTVLALLIVLFILVLFFSLMQQTLQFVLDIYNELSFRQITTG